MPRWLVKMCPGLKNEYYDPRTGTKPPVSSNIKHVELGLEDIAAEVLDQRPDP
jgi:hypothetical protein